MRARSKLNPGQPGTKKLVRQYGDRLVCVRYRHDALNRRRFTTAEILVTATERDPILSAVSRRECASVRVGLWAVRLREKVRAAGGRRDPESRVWRLPMEPVARMSFSGQVWRAAAVPPSDPLRTQPEGGLCNP